MNVDDANEFPYVYRREGTEHLIVDRRDKHLVGRYEHLEVAVAVGAALNEEHQRRGHR